MKNVQSKIPKKQLKYLSLVIDGIGSFEFHIYEVAKKTNDMISKSHSSNLELLLGVKCYWERR